MKILRDLNLDNVVFLDIETVQVVPELVKDTDLYKSWEYKVKYNKELVEKGEKTYEQMFNDQAQLYPEFGKIVCITIGKIKDGELKVKTFADKDETILLKQFNHTMNNIIAENKKTVLCGHFIVGFDIPFIMTRCIINQVEPCSLVDVAHLKPWEVTCIDTQTLWKGTSLRSASLINIATALGLPSPKDEMFGYETSKVYYTEEGGLKRIAQYCEKDVLTVANIVRKCRFEDVVGISGTTIVANKVGSLERIFNTKQASAKEEKELVQKFNLLQENEQKAAEDILSVALPTKKK